MVGCGLSFERCRLALAVAVLCVAVLPGGILRAQVEGGGTSQRAPAPVVSGPLVQDFAFLAGRWRGGISGGLFDEEWSEPSADCMMGMFRYMEDGKLKFYEFMVIEASPSGPILHLRHFDPGLTGWEEKDAPLSFTVDSSTESQVVFVNADKSTTLTYRRSSPVALTEVLEREAGGHKGKQQFAFGLIH
jgi:Domain of unknown function (DUF6265)